LAKRPSLKDSERNQFRINDQIRVPEVRLVGDNLEEISSIIGQSIESGILPTRKAREWAERLELDLVEISPNARPPVCRIVDYNKFLYDKKKKEKEIKAKAPCQGLPGGRRESKSIRAIQGARYCVQRSG
jgi:translation initiation factor IF-3